MGTFPRGRFSGQRQTQLRSHFSFCPFLELCTWNVFRKCRLRKRQAAQRGSALPLSHSFLVDPFSASLHHPTSQPGAGPT